MPCWHVRNSVNRKIHRSSPHGRIVERCRSQASSRSCDCLLDFCQARIDTVAGVPDRCHGTIGGCDSCPPPNIRIAKAIPAQSPSDRSDCAWLIEAITPVRQDLQRASAPDAALSRTHRLLVPEAAEPGLRKTRSSRRGTHGDVQSSASPRRPRSPTAGMSRAMTMLPRALCDRHLGRPDRRADRPPIPPGACASSDGGRFG